MEMRVPPLKLQVLLEPNLRNLVKRTLLHVEALPFLVGRPLEDGRRETARRLLDVTKDTARHVCVNTHR